MESFLSQVSAQLYAEYGQQMDRLCLVFPGRRAKLFFSEALATHLDRPIWQPESLSLSELVYAAAEGRPGEPLLLLSDLYQVYKEISGSEDSFDHFFSLGEVILRDFDLIDKYQVDARAIFQNVLDLKALEGDYSFLTPEQLQAIQMFQGSFGDGKGELQARFLGIWKWLYPLYEAFGRRLEEKQRAYEGLLYRRVAAQPERLLGAVEKQVFVFIGFNALNTCEKAIFTFLQKRGMAKFFWDYDNYYVQNEIQEAGLFMRENLEKFPAANKGCIQLSESKDIHVWKLPSELLQTKWVPELVSRYGLHPDKRTAVVLCDENLLIPLLYALPEAAEAVNVTMGYAFSKTSLYALIDSLLLLYQSARKCRGEPLFYHVEVSRFLQHPYIRCQSGAFVKALQKRMVQENLIYASPSLFADDDFLAPLANIPQTPSELLARLLTLLQALEEGQPEKEDLLFKPVLQLARNELHKLEMLWLQEMPNSSLELTQALIRQYLRQCSVAFNGEPLEGMQVMGVLETRALDFEHLIVLSAQEGFLPSTGDTPSFIPYSLRKGFGLPVSEQHEAIYAYYFYRLIQRAQKICLCYAASQEKMQTGEPSRYLLQMQAELPYKLQQHQVDMAVLPPPRVSPIVQPKEGEAMLRLRQYMQGGDAFLTPSSVNVYLKCPLRFYFQYIKKLKEEKTLQEEVDGGMVGNLLHRVMKSLYKGCLPISRPVQKAELEALAADEENLKEHIKAAILKEYGSQDRQSERLFVQGRWLLLSDVLLSYVRQILAVDAKLAPFSLLELEKEIHGSIDLKDAEGNVFTLHVGGIIDRVHEKEGRLYILDYKTGRDTAEMASLPDLFAPEAKMQNGAVFQIFWYALLYNEQYPGREVVPVFYFLRSLFTKDAQASLVTDKSDKETVTEIGLVAAAYKEQLASKLQELFDFSRSFVQTSDKEHCNYCPYADICGINTTFLL
jgi:hypothetical protein